jgi:hypothetical protein
MRHESLASLAALERGVCAKCRKTLRPGAKFCTRCGAAIPHIQPPPLPYVASQRVTMDAVNALQFSLPPQTVRPGRKSSRLGKLIAFVIVAAVGWVILWHWNQSNLSFPDWVKENLDESVSTPPSPPAPLSLPAAPDPKAPLPSRIGATAGVTIQQAWTQTQAVDADGVVGLRVHAQVYAPGVTGLRLVAHFRSANGGLVYADDEQYRDPNGEAACAGTVLPSTVVSKLTAFIPVTALRLLPGEENLKLLPALFDERNQPVATGLAVPFTFARGNTFITSIKTASLPGGGRRIKVDLQRMDRSTALSGQVIVRFKDATGTPLPGTPAYSNAAGDLRAVANFHIPAGPGMAAVNDITLLMPAGMVPPVCNADVQLFDPVRGVWLSPGVNVSVP